MTSSITPRFPGLVRRGSVAVLGLVAALALAACGQDDSSSDASGDEVRIAFLVGSLDNAYQATSVQAAEAEAERLGAKVTVYDAGFDPNKQVAQLEDVVGLGSSRFDGVAIVPVDNQALVPATQQAVEEGLAVGVANGPVGPDFDTADPQVDGVVSYVGVVWEKYGMRVADLTKEACEGIDPCNVVLTTGLQNWAPENAFKEVFKEEVADQENIEIISEPGPTDWSRDGGLQVIGDTVEAQDDISVIIAADQALLGAQRALEDAGVLGEVKLIGLGGADQSVAQIQNGNWFATVGQAPKDEGRLVVEDIVQYVRDGDEAGGTDSQSLIVNDAKITKEHVDEFEPQFEG